MYLITTSRDRPARRRRLLAVVAVVALAAGVTACGSDGSEESRTGGGSRDAAADADAFPVEIEHRYGTTEITEKPERVVLVGLVEQDAFLALGVKPVATTEWFGEHPGAVWPWAQEAAAAADGEEIEVLSDADGINYEQIARLRPDVIVGLYSGLTRDDYDTLAEIAPTVAQPGEHPDYGIPWQELTEKVGLIVGESERADELIAEVEEQFAEAAAAHPELDGARAAMAMPYEGIYVYGREDPRGRFLASLGMVVPEEIDAVAGEEFGGQLSEERAELLDVDVLVWLDPEDAEGDLGGPLYAGLDVHTEGREVLLDSEAPDALGGATSFVSVLSLPFLLDGLVPRLAAAVDGDPATEVPTS